MYTSVEKKEVESVLGNLSSFEAVMKFMESFLSDTEPVSEKKEVEREKVYSIKISLLDDSPVISIINNSYQKYVNFLKDPYDIPYVTVKNSKGDLLFFPNKNISFITVKEATKEETDSFYNNKALRSDIING